MSYHKQFNRILDHLYHRRTDKLRHLLIRRPGPVRTLTKKKRESTIQELKEIVTKALAKKMFNKRFKALAVKEGFWPTKGWGTDKKQGNFQAWVRRRIPSMGGKIYVFWKNRECRYVGRTLGRGSRPSIHFKRSWFNGTTRIDVYVARQKSSIPSLECLAIHHFRPTENKMRAAKKSWTPKCPLCALHKKIRTELRKIYRFR